MHVWTPDGSLPVGQASAIKMYITITCTKYDCSVAENVTGANIGMELVSATLKPSLTTSPTSLLIINEAWTSASSNSLNQYLGIEFPSPGTTVYVFSESYLEIILLISSQVIAI